MYNILIETLNDKLPIELLNIIMTYSRSKEAEIFMEQLKINGSDGIRYKRNIKDLSRYVPSRYKLTYFPYIWGNVSFSTRYFSSATNLPYPELENKYQLNIGKYFYLTPMDSKKSLTIKDIKKMCEENGLKRKSFKTKKEWIKYYIKNT